MTCRLRWCVEMETRCKIPIWRTGEFNGMSSQSHISHCRVLPLGEFTVMIPQPHATLQGVRIPSGILKIVFRHISLFLFLMQFRLWRAAAFVSSPIHLFWLSMLFYVSAMFSECSECFNKLATQANYTPLLGILLLLLKLSQENWTNGFKPSNNLKQPFKR